MREARSGIGGIGKRGKHWIVSMLVFTQNGPAWRDWPWQYRTYKEARNAFHRIPKDWTGAREAAGDA